MKLPQDGTKAPDSLAPANLREVSVALPEGMAINPAAAGGLVACADNQLHLKTQLPAECPDAAKVATAVATTPLLAES